jgi:diguanylate cyclase (GGDEF)-like protein
MTSLQHNLNLKEQEERFGSLREFGEMFASLLSLIADSPFGGEPTLVEAFRADLLRQAERLKAADSFEQLRSAHRMAETQLRGFNETADELLKSKDQALKQLLGLVNQAATQFLGHHEQYSTRVGSTQAGLQEALRASSMMVMREQVRSQSKQLSESMAFMEREANANVAQLRAQLDEYRTKLQMAEELASTDSLTGLANRREAERQIDAAIASNTSFSLIFIDLNGFKAINDQYGHACGDQVLGSFGKSLKRWFRPLDTVARWGGDEFLIMMARATETEAARKCQDLRNHTLGQYRIVLGGRILNVEVRAAFGIAQWQSGETAQQIIERADKAAYAEKPKGTR